MTKTKKRHCEICGKELSEDEACELNGMILCEDCYDEEEDLEESRKSGSNDEHYRKDTR